MSKIIDVQDILADARACVTCLSIAAQNSMDGDPIVAVANVAIDKIKEAEILLQGFRDAQEDRPVSAAQPNS